MSKAGHSPTQAVRPREDYRGVVGNVGAMDEDDAADTDDEAWKLFGDDDGEEEGGQAGREDDGQEVRERERADEQEMPEISDVIEAEGRWRRPRRYAVADRRRRLNIPRLPTQEEIEDHVLRHIPRQDWC